MIRYFIVITLLVSTAARGEVALSTINEPTEFGLCFGDESTAGGYNWAAAGFTATVSSGIDEVRFRLRDPGSDGGSFTATLHADSGGAVGAAIAEVGTGFGSQEGLQAPTNDVYTLSPAARIPLSSGATYWIVMTSSVRSTCAMAFSLGGLTPTGDLFSYVGNRQLNNGNLADATSLGVLQFEISVTRDSDGDGVYDPDDAFPDDPTRSAMPAPALPSLVLLLAAALLSLVGVRRLRL